MRPVQVGVELLRIGVDGVDCVALGFRLLDEVGGDALHYVGVLADDGEFGPVEFLEQGKDGFDDLRGGRVRAGEGFVEGFVGDFGFGAFLREGCWWISAGVYSSIFRTSFS